VSEPCTSEAVRDEQLEAKPVEMNRRHGFDEALRRMVERRRSGVSVLVCGYSSLHPAPGCGTRRGCPRITYGGVRGQAFEGCEALER
jgi:hypothetical protein